MRWAACEVIFYSPK